MRQLIVASRLGRTEYQLLLMKISWWDRNVKIRYKLLVVIDEFLTVQNASGLLFIFYLSVVWHCCVSSRKGIRTAETEWWGTGMVICLERGANDLHMVQLMPLPPHHCCSSKIQNCLPFWCWLAQAVLIKRPLNGCISSSYVGKNLWYWYQIASMKGETPPIHQQYSCDWRKKETRPLSRVSALGSLQCFDTRAVQRLIFITARRHASAVYAVVVCLSQVSVLLKQLNAGSCKQCHTVAQGLPDFYCQRS